MVPRFRTPHAASPPTPNPAPVPPRPAPLATCRIQQQQRGAAARSGRCGAAGPARGRCVCDAPPRPRPVALCRGCGAARPVGGGATRCCGRFGCNCGRGCRAAGWQPHVPVHRNGCGGEGLAMRAALCRARAAARGCRGCRWCPRRSRRQDLRRIDPKRLEGWSPASRDQSLRAVDKSYHARLPAEAAAASRRLHAWRGVQGAADLKPRTRPSPSRPLPPPRCHPCECQALEPPDPKTPTFS